VPDIGKNTPVFFPGEHCLITSKPPTGNQRGIPTREPYIGHLSNRKGLWESKIPRNHLPFRRGKKTNHIQWHVNDHFSGIQRIQAKVKQVLYPPEAF
jgi:hypothetical protein